MATATKTKGVTADKNLDEQKELRPIDLRTYDGPLYVQNKNPLAQLVCSSADGNERVKLGPFGNSEGTDVALLPASVAREPGFQKVWRSGGVSVTTDPKMEEILLEADMQQIKKDRIRAEKSAQSLDAPMQDKDLTGYQCLECGQQVFMSAGENKRRPPLCASHEYLFEDAPYKFIGTPQKTTTGTQIEWNKIKEDK